MASTRFKRVVCSGQSRPKRPPSAMLGQMSGSVFTLGSVTALNVGRHPEISYACRKYCFMLYALQWPAAEGRVDTRFAEHIST